MAGASGGVLGAVITSPLEVVKTRMQAAQYIPQVKALHAQAGASRIRGATVPFSFMRQMVRAEGVPSLWSGIMPTIVGVIPARAIYFFTYTSLKKFLVARYQRENSFIHAASAVIACASTSTATNPLWVVKTRLQLEGGKGAGNLGVAGVSRVVKSIYQTDGLKGFYRGLTSSYAGRCSTAGLSID